ncbi:MAG: RidA family protein [Saprospiraceae bacterium]|nr:RidA family protein [Saprospiraceae bacterium]
MKRESLNPPNDWGATYLMDQGLVVTGHTRTCYLSGQVALETDTESPMGVRVVHPGDMRQQLGHVLNKIDALLEQAGMARKNIVFVRFYATDNTAFLDNYDVYADWIDAAGIKPPQTDIGVNELAIPGLVIEVEVVAAD